MSLQPPEQDEMDDPEDYIPRFHLDPLDYPDQVSIEEILKRYPPPDDLLSSTDTPDSPIEIIQPLPTQEPYDTTEEEGKPAPKRRPGAPKGNLNALKHGLYVESRAIHNTTPIERAQLMDFNGIITHFKHYMEETYRQGLKAKSLAEYNETMRSLSMGLLALSRSVTVHNGYSYSCLPSKLAKRKNVTADQVIDYYSNKVSFFPEELDTAPDDKVHT